MRKVFAVGAVAAAVAAAFFAARAAAIIGGTADTTHTGVGYAVFYDTNRVPLWRCTAELVSSRVMLTAGHCAGRYDNDTGFHRPVVAQVWFDDTVPAASGGYPDAGGVSCSGYTGWPCTGGDAIGLPVAHPQYVGSRAVGTENDIGVIVLAREIQNRQILDLAKLHTLDNSDPGDVFTVVGYGNQSQTPPPVDTRQRAQGAVKLIRVESKPNATYPDDEPGWADFTNYVKPGTPSAAACNGDSGGPVLDANGDIVAVIALVDADPADSPVGDGFCQGVAFHFRTDTPTAKKFLAKFGVKIGGNDNRDDGSGRKRGQDLTGRD